MKNIKKLIAFFVATAILLPLSGCVVGVVGEVLPSDELAQSAPERDDGLGASSEPSGDLSTLFREYERLEGYTHVPSDPLRVRENVLVDEAGITVKALWVDPTPKELLEWQTEPGPHLELLVTNSSGKPVALHVTEAAVNSYTVDAHFWEYLYTCDGTELQFTMPFYCEDLLEVGLTDIALLGLKFEAYDLEDDENPILTTDMRWVETELADSWTDSVNTDGTLIYEDENFTIKVLGSTTRVTEYNGGNYHNPQMNRVEGGALLVYLENRAEYPVWFQVWSSVVNDTVLDLYIANDCEMLSPGGKRITHADMHFRDIEEYGYSEICDATVSFAVYRCQGEEPDMWVDEQLLTTEKVGMSFGGVR